MNRVTNESTGQMTDTTPKGAPREPTIPPTMTAVVARRYGSPDVIAVDEVDVPTPGSAEVLVRVEASSLNALDWHFLTGTPYVLRLTNGLRRPKRVMLGADVAGTVVAVGTDVADIAVGDRVLAESGGGGCSEFAVVRASSLATITSDVEWTALGATPAAGLTALQGLRTHADVQPGERVLINGAAGGVGTFAVQIAHHLAAEVTAVCSGRNVDMVRALGADHVIDYTSDDVVDVVAGSERFDVMLDNVGSRTPKENVSMLVPGGRYVSVSGPKTNRWLDPMRYAARMWWACTRSRRRFHVFVAEPNATDLADLARLLADGTITPAIDRVIGFDGVAAAMAEIGGGHARSKIVVVPDR